MVAKGLAPFRGGQTCCDPQVPEDCHSAAISGGDAKVWLWGSYKDSGGHIGFPDYTAPSRDKSWKVTTPGGDTALREVLGADPHGGQEPERPGASRQANYMFVLLEKGEAGQKRRAVVYLGNGLETWRCSTRSGSPLWRIGFETFCSAV